MVVSGSKLAREFETDPSTVSKIAKRFYKHRQISNEPRSGRPSILTPSEKKYILLLTKRDRAITYSALTGNLDHQCSIRTIRRFLQRYWKRKWKSLDREKMKPEHAALRLGFARQWLPRVKELMEVYVFEV
jgi:transposase